MTNDPMDTVIGIARPEQRDVEAATRHHQAALAAEKAGDRNLAITELRRACAADPVNARYLFDLAYQLDLVGEEDEALALYERSCEDTPSCVNALINLAVLYEDRGDYPRAERCLRQVLDTYPNHARARLFMKDVQASREMIVDDEQDRDTLRRGAMLDMPVTDFELSVRTRTCLKKMSIRTLGDLLRVTEAELMSYKNFGDSSLDEIKEMLATRNLKLGQGRADAHRQARRQVMEQLKGSGAEMALNKPVSDLNLSVRARRTLQLLNIQTIGDLVSHTEAELMGIKNFGTTSLVEVKERLEEFGLSLRILDGD
jgi:DNA-directed RNA polymerase subunit alpha